MARAVGARVLATAGSNENVQICRQLGATVAVNYKTDDLDDGAGQVRPDRRVVRDAARTGFRSSGQPFGDAGSHHRDGGPRVAAQVSRRPVLREGRQAAWALRCSTPRPSEQRKCAAEINRWLAKGKLRPRIGRVMKLSETAAAHRLQEENTLGKAGTLAGKIVLVP